MHLTHKQWIKEVESGKVQDISDELPDSFLMFGQTMRAKIIYQGKKWYANAWSIDNFVRLEEVKGP